MPSVVVPALSQTADFHLQGTTSCFCLKVGCITQQSRLQPSLSENKVYPQMATFMGKRIKHQIYFKFGLPCPPSSCCPAGPPGHLSPQVGMKSLIPPVKCEVLNDNQSKSSNSKWSCGLHEGCHKDQEDPDFAPYEVQACRLATYKWLQRLRQAFQTKGYEASMRKDCR